MNKEINKKIKYQGRAFRGDIRSAANTKLLSRIILYLKINGAKNFTSISQDLIGCWSSYRVKDGLLFLLKLNIIKREKYRSDTYKYFLNENFKKFQKEETKNDKNLFVS